MDNNQSILNSGDRRLAMVSDQAIYDIAKLHSGKIHIGGCTMFSKSDSVVYSSNLQVLDGLLRHHLATENEGLRTFMVTKSGSNTESEEQKE